MIVPLESHRSIFPESRSGPLLADRKENPIGAVDNPYDFAEVESRWRARWDSDQLWHLDIHAVGPDQKFYNLVEFPYPSGEGLHVGHVYTFSGADVFSRYMRMCGKKVFQPIGFDSFGIHTENYALRVDAHPRTLTARTIQHFRKQLREIGVAWNWEHEIVTSDPTYYRWTQWIFVQLFKAGLAVRKEAPVVWCPSCLTVLAHEQIEAGRCERCSTPITYRVMLQWFLRITAYAERLLAGLNSLDWPESAKLLQREWIGRTEGSDIDFPVLDTDIVLTIFTTRIETIFGATFVALAPEHPMLPSLVRGTERETSVLDFADRLRRTPAPDRQLEYKRDVLDGGYFTGRRAINPATGQPVPIYVADYVLTEYGTGAVMGVPAHDERDYAFAKSFGLPILKVISSQKAPVGEPWTGSGIVANSGPFDGTSSESAKESIAAWIEQRALGRPAVRYRLHDWLISRQRYWGPPIPIIYCDTCGTLPVPEDQLPVILPDVENFRPTGTGLSPLAGLDSFVDTTCFECGGSATRETDVSDTFLDSAWYFLRYPSSDLDDRPWDLDRTHRLLPVDLYAGGKEHIVRHHLYARFVTIALNELGLIPFDEPFPCLRLHGLLIKEGAKMSKSRGNVVSPDDYLVEVGADNLRMYLLFCGDWSEGGDFRDVGLRGIVRFSTRVWRLLTTPFPAGSGGVDMTVMHRAITRIERDIERLKFNGAIAGLMELTNWLQRTQREMSKAEWQAAAQTFTLMLAPFAPFLAEELWARLGGQYSVHLQNWPEVDPFGLQGQTVLLVIQVDGRVRDRQEVPFGIDEKTATTVALESARVRRYLKGNRPRRVIYIPNRVINLVS